MHKMRPSVTRRPLEKPSIVDTKTSLATLGVANGGGVPIAGGGSGGRPSGRPSAYAAATAVMAGNAIGESYQVIIIILLRSLVRVLFSLSLFALCSRTLVGASKLFRASSWCSHSRTLVTSPFPFCCYVRCAGRRSAAQGATEGGGLGIQKGGGGKRFSAMLLPTGGSVR